MIVKGTFTITRCSPDWVSDFKTSPFNAHALVELDGNPIGESISLSKFQKVLFVKGKQND